MPKILYHCWVILLRIVSIFLILCCFILSMIFHSNVFNYKDIVLLILFINLTNHFSHLAHRVAIEISLTYAFLLVVDRIDLLSSGYSSNHINCCWIIFEWVSIIIFFFESMIIILVYIHVYLLFFIISLFII